MCSRLRQAGTRLLAAIAAPWRWWRTLDPHHQTASATLGLALATFVLAMGTVLLVIVNRAMLDEMRNASNDTKNAIQAANRLAAASEKSARIANDALDSARENFRAGERPIVWLDMNTGRSPPLFYPKDPTSDEGAIFWTFGWHNYGRSPAIHVNFSRTILIEGDSFQLPELAAGVPIAPNQSENTTANSKPNINRKISTGCLKPSMESKLSARLSTRMRPGPCTRRLSVWLGQAYHLKSAIA